MTTIREDIDAIVAALDALAVKIAATRARGAAMNPLRKLHETDVDEAAIGNERDLEIVHEALGRIEGRKRFTPNAIMCKVAVAQAMVIEARLRMNSFYSPLWREEVIAEHGPMPGSEKDHR